MMQPGNGEFADAEVPIRMAGPLHIEIVAIVEGQGDAFPLELIDDGSVVDALDGKIAIPIAIEEASPFALELRYIYGADAEAVFMHVEVGQRLLRFRLDLQQNDVLRCMVADDHAMQEGPIACVVMTIEKVLEISRQMEGARVALEQHCLKAKDRGKGLQLHEARRKRAIVFADQAEVGRHEVGMD